MRARPGTIGWSQMHGSEQMSEPFSQFVGSIPENYDRGLGPHVFVDYAADLAARVAASQPTDVLELAAGTGIVTRRLRDALSAQCSLIATAGSLAGHRSLPPVSPGGRVTAPPARLPLEIPPFLKS